MTIGALPITMAPAGGGKSVATEFGWATPFSCATKTPRDGVATSGFNLSTFVGHSNGINIVVSADTTTPLNVFTAAGSPGGAVNVTVTINAGVTQGSNSTATAAITVPNSFAGGSTISIVNNGNIVGRGGGGAAQTAAATSNSSRAGSAGAAGGPALSISRAVSITNNGVIGGGGGGGGSGCSKNKNTRPNYNYLGGSGGGGAGYGSPGTAADPSVASVAGTATAGGIGGKVFDSANGVPVGIAGGIGGSGPGVAGTGGSGGVISPGGGGGGLAAAGGAGATGASAGGAGGAAGTCTASGSNANITWTVAGSRYGSLI